MCEYPYILQGHKNGMDENKGDMSSIGGGSEFKVRSKSNNTSSIMDQI